jgi:polyisoprenoid-binding protein YceI
MRYKNKIQQAQYLFILISFFYTLSTSLAGEYHVDKTQKNMVKFISDAPIEDFEGITENLLNNSEIYLEVDLNSLDTGIGLRNRHMRDNYLHTDKFPITHYSGKIINSEKIKGDTLKVKTAGKIFIHGIEKPLAVEGIVVSLGNKRFNIQSNFQVKLTDFDIEIPSLMFFKIDETMELLVNFYIKKYDPSAE